MLRSGLRRWERRLGPDQDSIRSMGYSFKGYQTYYVVSKLCKHDPSTVIGNLPILWIIICRPEKEHALKMTTYRTSHRSDNRIEARGMNLRDVFFRKHAIRCDRYLFGSLTKFNSKPYTIDLDGFCRYLIKDIHTMEAATVCRTRSLSLNCAILRPSITFSVKSTMPRV